MEFRARLVRLNSFFSKKNNILIYLIIFIGVLIPSLSPSFDTNIWNRLLSILNNPFFNCMYFFAIGLNVMYMVKENSKSFNFIIRFNNYHNLIKSFIKDIIIYTIFLYFISFILSFAGSILFSLDNFSMVDYFDYSFPVIIYIIFFAIRSIMISCLLNIIIYLLTLNRGKILSTIILTINSSLFLVLPQNYKIINHFYDLHIFPQYYYMYNSYSTFMLETICTII